MYLIYSLLYAAAALVLLIPQYLKRPKEVRSRWLREKLGLPDIPASQQSAKSLWVHAVSVGEVTASIALISRLKAEYPDCPVILSTMTDTGQQVARSKVPAGVRVLYMPFDLAFIIKRFISRTNPGLFVIVETEIWPNVIRVAAEKGLPVFIVNGRISEKSFRGYSRISPLMKRFLRPVTSFLMQTEADADRIRRMGAEKERVIVTGSFKFDIPQQPAPPSWAGKLKGTVIVAGSTHPGEEALMLDVLRKNLSTFPLLKLVLAPRHPERFQEVEELVKSSGITFVRRTTIETATSSALADAKIVILDSIGELASVYGIADIAVIGKSFIGRGGQNPLEPAQCGKAIICGPHMENFPFIREFYDYGAAFEVSAAGLADEISRLLSSPDKAREAGTRARELYLKNAGAVDRSFGIIDAHMRQNK